MGCRSCRLWTPQVGETRLCEAANDTAALLSLESHLNSKGEDSEEDEDTEYFDAMEDSTAFITVIAEAKEDRWALGAAFSKSHARWHFCFDWPYCSLNQKRPQSSLYQGFLFNGHGEQGTHWLDPVPASGGRELGPLQLPQALPEVPTLVQRWSWVSQASRGCASTLGGFAEHLLPQRSESGSLSKSCPGSHSPT